MQATQPLVDDFTLYRKPFPCRSTTQTKNGIGKEDYDLGILFFVFPYFCLANIESFIHHCLGIVGFFIICCFLVVFLFLGFFKSQSRQEF